MTIIDYFTKWLEDKDLKLENIEELTSFIEENVFSHFGFPEKFITNNGSIFIGSKFTFVGNMVLPWGDIQITTHKEMGLQSLQTKHSFKSSKI